LALYSTFGVNLNPYDLVRGTDLSGEVDLVIVSSYHMSVDHDCCLALLLHLCFLLWVRKGHRDDSFRVVLDNEGELLVARVLDVALVGDELHALHLVCCEASRLVLLCLLVHFYAESLGIWEDTTEDEYVLLVV